MDRAMKAKLPSNEVARLEALLDYRIIDTLPEDSYDDITLLASNICDTPMAAVSLITPNGEALGTLCVIDQIQRTLTEQQINSLRALSRQLMAQLELRRHVELQEKNQRILKDYQDKHGHLLGARS